MTEVLPQFGQNSYLDPLFRKPFYNQSPMSNSSARIALRTRLSQLLLFILLTGTMNAQHQLDIGLFQSATPNVLELRVRSDQTFQFVVSEITFTIRWETASGADLGAISLGTCPSSGIPLVASGDGQVDVGGFRYQTYSGFGQQQLQQCPSQPGYSWPAGQEVVIATIPVSNVSNCANFNIVNDAYTAANNKDFYSSFGGSPVTGAIYSSPVQICANVYVDVAAKAFLDGAYNSGTGLMNENLRTLSLIPSGHPYGGSPFNHAGTETVASGVLSVTGNNAIVDWVLLELRNSASPSSIVAKRAALIQRDGDIVDLDGISPVRFTNMASSNYYVAVRHRNHLGVMTASTRALSSTSTAINFTLAGTTTYGTNARRTVGGVMTMWGGNANSNGNVRWFGLANDQSVVLSTVGATTPTATLNNTYHIADVNMNGNVRWFGLTNDQAFILTTVGATTPTGQVNQALP